MAEAHENNTPTPLRIESSPTPEVNPVTCRMIIPKTDLPLYEEVGSKHNVHLATVSEEGEQYTHYTEDFDTHKPHSHTDKVPEGKIYGELSSTRPDWSDFWKELEAKQQASSETDK